MIRRKPHSNWASDIEDDIAAIYSWKAVAILHSFKRYDFCGFFFL
jgi:hypothetical protein